MVAWTSYDACWKNRRRALADIPAGRPGNAKGVHCPTGLLANVTVRQLWPVRAKKRNFHAFYDSMRNCHSRRNVMILELEEGFGALVHISPQPMRQTVKSLEAEQAVTKFGANGPWTPGL